jgi:hypothetical protein
MSIGLRAFGIATVLAVVGALLLGRRHKRTPAALATVRPDSGVEECI